MKSFSNKDKYETEKKANTIRRQVIEMLMEAGSGHPAGALGMADIFAVLYLHFLRHDPEDPFWEERDRVILSNGHICPVLYATLAEVGYFSKEELKTLRRLGSRLQGHPHRGYLPGIETTSGPLGCGLSQAAGMAIADRMDRGDESESYFYCFMGDGELNSGNIWEAGMLASKERLGKLVGVIDRNNIQIDGFTKDVMPLEPLRDKWESWGWLVYEIDGHNIDQIYEAFEKVRSSPDTPKVIIANTIPGKGVFEFEGKYEWHGKAPDADEGGRALKELAEEDREIDIRYKGLI